MSFDESAVLGAVKAGGVSIPLEQGNVFRRIKEREQALVKSQSLWNRAMSFDYVIARKYKL